MGLKGLHWVGLYICGKKIMYIAPALFSALEPQFPNEYRIGWGHAPSNGGNVVHGESIASKASILDAEPYSITC